MRGKAAAMVGLMLAAVTPGAAQTPDRAAERALAPFVACRAADPRGRAACYDTALERLQQAVRARDIVIVDRRQLAEERPVGAGLRAAPGPVRRTEPERIESTVAAARSIGYDRWIIRLASGGAWRTVDATPTFDPRVGDTARVWRNVMGGYMIRIGRGPSLQAARAN